MILLKRMCVETLHPASGLQSAAPPTNVIQICKLTVAFGDYFTKIFYGGRGLGRTRSASRLAATAVWMKRGKNKPSQNENGDTGVSFRLVCTNSRHFHATYPTYVVWRFTQFLTHKYTQPSTIHTAAVAARA